ncbi:LuxR C-terminal-related transcriptional regulator [Cyclobacterium salsum]|uniref:LuxR C-terminal-related transcriptional regulator n=1 Tax=Cyclobacterium salsum TaxID=2666329 RepID=UPI0013915BF7|nr:LuxR C-terminal-related transcriptional regulator [Cyclobacterium salsum]
MEKKIDYIDLVKAFGKQNYTIFKKDFQEAIKKNPILTGLWTVGKWFSFIANTYTWELEMVTGNSMEVIGYSNEEIVTRNKDFISSFIHQEDFPFVIHVIHEAMRLVNDLEIKERPFVFVVFYARSVKKNGEVIVIQNQNIPLVFDENNIPFVFANIITDISHLQPANIPHAIIINGFSNQHYHLSNSSLGLKPLTNLFSARELEILKWLIKGYTSKEISQLIQISYETVRTHRRNIQTKAKCKNTRELINFVMMNKIA